jgi:hypothetical protein
VSVAYHQTWAFRFLFRLSAKAHRLSRKDLFRRLLVGLSNRFDAVTCSFYSMSGSAPSRSTEAAQEAAPIAGELRRISAAVAKLCRSRRRVVSALDLPESYADSLRRIEEILGPCDTLGFPLLADGRLHGCIVLCLRGEEGLVAPDLHALLSIGECLHVAFASAKDGGHLVDAA